MRKKISLSLLILVAILLMGGSATAVKPGEEVNPNGYPSGEHYNLNIIGKKDGFKCHEAQLNGDGDQTYGSAIFVPENAIGEIYMESGKGQKFAEISQLEVIDNCACDGDGARIRLPKNEAGYSVYARALGKPGGTTTLRPELREVQDENGITLFYLGLVTSNGFKLADQPFTRDKGKSRSIEITDLFRWYGEICYLSDLGGNYDYTKSVCCVRETVVDPDTVVCDAYEEVTVETICLDESIFVYCNNYTIDDPVWIFDIGDFVEYLWYKDNHGTKLLQVRFYPN